MTLVFYFAPFSTATVTSYVIAELDLPHERRQMDLKASSDASNSIMSASFLALNPNGMVPTIVHDGAAIWESGAITMYLGEQFGVARNLYPELGPKRGQAMMWIVWAGSTLGAAASRVMKTDAAGKDEALAKMNDSLSILETALGQKAFLLGDAFTLVDCHMYAIVELCTMLKVDISIFPHVDAWARLCSQRPALAKK